MRCYTTLKTLIGELYIVAENDKLSAIHFGEEEFLNQEDSREVSFNPSHEVLVDCSRQLQEYFSGTRTEFDLPLKQRGTPFQMAVWQQLASIPFGETRSYEDIAIAINNPKAVRAIGQANKRNQLPIIVPCHRVIGKNKSLTGYAGSKIDLKEKLLKIEGVLP